MYRHTATSLWVILLTDCTLLLFCSVTGASFIVFSGALKPSSPFMAKVNIVEGLLPVCTQAIFLHLPSNFVLVNTSTEVCTYSLNEPPGICYQAKTVPFPDIREV